VVVEVGDSESLGELQKDAYWWLTNSKDQVRMVIIIKISKDLMSLRLEHWEKIDDERALSTRNQQPKIPGFKYYWRLTPLVR